MKHFHILESGIGLSSSQEGDIIFRKWEGVQRKEAMIGKILERLNRFLKFKLPFNNFTAVDNKFLKELLIVD